MTASSTRGNLIIGCVSSEVSPAAEVIASNADLLTQILVCLPAKSLGRFKSVSKQWLSLISDSQFGTYHSRRNHRPSGLFLCCKNTNEEPKYVSLQGDPYLPTLDFLNRFGSIRWKKRIIHSYNGLLLCEYLQFYHHFRISVRYLVCNPTTQTCTLIPEPPAVLSSARMPCELSVFLAFDPSKTRPHYKVLFLGFDSYVQIDIYCSQSVSWKQFRAPGTRIRHKAFCGGVVHWLCDDNVLFGFDVDSEKMIEMPSPPIIYSVYMIRYFGECDGRLILIETQTLFDMAFTILEMDKDCRSWIVKCLVDIGALQSVYPQLGTKYGYSVVCVVKGEKEEDFALVLAIGGKVISYNLECKTWKVLCDVAYGHLYYALPKNGPLYLTAHPYIQNLSPV